MIQARYVIVGCLALLWAFQLVIVGQASAIAEQNSFSRVGELVPAFLQRGLGSRAMLLATFKGTVAFGYFHPVVVVLLSVLAIYLTTEPAHEVEAGLVDLELARSVPRHALITRSLVAAAVAISVAAAMMGFGTWLGLRAFASPSFGAPSAGTIAMLLIHLIARRGGIRRRRAGDRGRGTPLEHGILRGGVRRGGVVPDGFPVDRLAVDAADFLGFALPVLSRAGHRRWRCSPDRQSGRAVWNRRRLLCHRVLALRASRSLNPSPGPAEPPLLHIFSPSSAEISIGQLIGCRGYCRGRCWENTARPAHRPQYA